MPSEKWRPFCFGLNMVKGQWCCRPMLADLWKGKLVRFSVDNIMVWNRYESIIIGPCHFFSTKFTCDMYGCSFLITDTRYSEWSILLSGRSFARLNLCLRYNIRDSYTLSHWTYIKDNIKILSPSTIINTDMTQVVGIRPHGRHEDVYTFNLYCLYHGNWYSSEPWLQQPKYWLCLLEYISCSIRRVYFLSFQFSTFHLTAIMFWTPGPLTNMNHLKSQQG